LESGGHLRDAMRNALLAGSLNCEYAHINTGNHDRENGAISREWGTCAACSRNNQFFLFNVSFCRARCWYHLFAWVNVTPKLRPLSSPRVTMLRRSTSLIKRSCGGWRRSQRSRVLSTTTADVVSVHEVSARDGIQNEKTLLSVDQRLELIRRVVAINPSSVEVASFVRPDLVPAMAQSDELCQRLQELDWAQEARSQGMGFAALIPNARGYENFQKVHSCGPQLTAYVRLF